MPQGLLIILSSPSGAGKSTICRLLLKKHRNLRYSVSCTTRPPRPKEKHARDYFFLAPEEFQKNIRENRFLEWAEVHGHLYGTPRDYVERTCGQGMDVLLAIDVQGGLAIRRRYPDAVLIFIAPPSWETLRRRLNLRRESPESIERRLSNAEKEIKEAPKYDYLVVNDRLSQTVRAVESILAAERLKTSRKMEIVQRLEVSNV